MAIKSILAQMVNSILIPVLTAYYIKGNLYRTSGLVDNIFMLSITTIILPPLLIFFDFNSLLLKLIKFLKSRPSSPCPIQPANSTRPRKNTTSSTRVCSSRSATNTSTLSTSSSLSATSCRCSPSSRWSAWLATF